MIFKTNQISFKVGEYIGVFYYQHNGRYYNSQDNKPSMYIFSEVNVETVLAIFTDTFGCITKIVFADSKDNEYVCSDPYKNHLRGDISEMIRILTLFEINYNEYGIVKSPKVSEEISKLEYSKMLVFNHFAKHNFGQ